MLYEVLCDNVVEVAEALIRACYWHTSSLSLKAKMFALDQKQSTHAIGQFFKTRSVMQEFRWLGLGEFFFLFNDNGNKKCPNSVSTDPYSLKRTLCPFSPLNTFII